MLHLLLRYTQALITQMAQTAVCNRHHSVDQQLCRWLLLSLDRLSSNELSMTQELIANMLGVRREGVTEAAGKLQEAGLDPLPPRPHHGARPARAWRRAPASATRSSRRSSIACCRTSPDSPRAPDSAHICALASRPGPRRLFSDYRSRRLALFRVGIGSANAILRMLTR